MTSPTTAEAAAAYLRRKFKIAALRPREKAGLPGWNTEKITEEDIPKFFSGENNIGLILGKGSGGLTDLDLDCPEAISAARSYAPPTGMAIGRSSKRWSHFFYLSDLCETEDRASIPYKDVDGSMICELRIGGGGHAAQTAVPPSTHSSGERVVNESDGDPSWQDGPELVAAVGRVAAAAILARHWPAEGGRHDAALAVDGYLARNGWGVDERKAFIEAVALAAGDKEWRDRRRTSDNTDKKLARGDKISGFTKMAGIFSKEVAVRVSEWLQLSGDEADEALRRMNAEFAVVMDGSRTRILRFEDRIERGRDGSILNRRRIPVFLQFYDFYNYYLGEKVTIFGSDGKPRRLDLAPWWAKHPQRRRFAGIVFQPNAGETVDGRLNLWKGWGVEPAAGDWSLMLRHIREVIADGNEEAAEYILNWLAWTIQNPATPAQVALVLKGGKGVGKGTIGTAMCRIFGQHATQISSVEHLAGRFNAHLRDVCLLFADEAYWPGDKYDEGTLKRLITEPTLFIEAKGRDGVTVPNMLHVIMASNSDWVVPASEHERRYAVFQVSEVRRQDEAWFTPLFEQMEHGGYGAMLHDLLRRELGDWHPRRIPYTRSLREQQVRNLDPLDAWLIEFFESGLLPELTGTGRPDRPDRTLSHSNFEIDGRNSRNGLFDIARQRVPSLRRVNDQVLASHLKKWGCKPWRNSKLRGWEFPPLSECRARWEEKYPRWDWEHPEITEWQDHLTEDDKNMLARI
jgi:hypothetical protein